MEAIDLKLTVFGDSQVGKTCITLHFSSEILPANLEPTIGATYYQRMLQVFGKQVSFSCWDISGNPRYRSLCPMYFRADHAGIAVYNVGSRSSFDSVEEWCSIFRMNARERAEILLVGNRTDNRKEVTTEEGVQLARKLGVLFVEISAKQPCEVMVCFRMLGELTLRNQEIMRSSKDN